MNGRHARGPVAGARRSWRAAGVALAAVAGLASIASAPAQAAATPVKPAMTWTGRVPAGVPPPLVSSLATQQSFEQVWALCQVGGTPPAVDFATHLVVLAARRSSAVRFRRLVLADGNLVTDVAMAPDAPAYTTCALALVPRAGIARVNGAPPGR